MKTPRLANTAFLVLLTIIAPGCKKQNTITKDRIYFTGISPTDQNGNIMAAPDSTDWNASDKWGEQEEGLFANNNATNCTPSFDYKIAAYPNPCRYIFNLYLQKNPSTRMELRLVDENFKLLFSSNSITANNIAIQVGTFGIKDTVRLYYKFIENGCELKGHGDILIR